MIQLTQQVRAAGDGRVLHLVYDVAHVGGVARLVAVAARSPRRGVDLPPIELDGAHVEALELLPAVLHQIDPAATPTHVQIVYGPSRTDGTVRRAVLVWALADPDAVWHSETSRYATLTELFDHGGCLVSICEDGEAPSMARLVGRKVDAATYRALMLVGPRLESRVAHPEPAAA